MIYTEGTYTDGHVADLKVLVAGRETPAMTIAPAGPEVAAGFLRVILERPGRYRERWVRRAEKPREGEISQAAVARVIADYLLRHPSSTDEYRRLRSRVHRALNGRNLTPETLRWFINAFMMTGEDARQLWALFAGMSPDEVDPSALALTPTRDEAAAFHPSSVRVVSLHDIHVVGKDGLPIEHRVRLRIEATADHVTCYPVRCDTESISVHVADGHVSEIYRCGNGIYAFDVVLPYSLKKAETAAIEYVVKFEDITTSAPPEFRRVAIERVEDLTMEVQFDANRLPRTVWWASWPDPAPDSTPAIREPIRLNETRCIGKVLSCAERSVVGFCWEW